MLDDLRTKMHSIRQDYESGLDRLIVDLQDGRITGDQYRERASILRAQFFKDDNAVHAEMADRVKRKHAEEVPNWLSDPPKE